MRVLHNREFTLQVQSKMGGSDGLRNIVSSQGHRSENLTLPDILYALEQHPNFGRAQYAARRDYFFVNH